ncbi:hypothetical protein [Chamaesiphon sp. VAR_69_metabat_338]|uniref:hypothetical protein n=1 Tax=Chamaesiphon sp. VAR_69_metabat_338 TaxID=2964704 RepID=UPI00286E78BA|nr:hypothetical protein [Chamaesiphon sp. VAR_69_metabat_338]
MTYIKVLPSYCFSHAPVKSESSLEFSSTAILDKLQQNPRKTETIDADRQAEAFCLDRGDTDRAIAVTKTIEGIISRNLD